MKYYIFLVFLCSFTSYSQNDLNSAIKKYANVEWYNLELVENELVFKDYCFPIRFMFDDKEVVMMNAPEADRNKIDKITFDKSNKTLIIFASIKGGITEKITIHDDTIKGKNVVAINVVLYIGVEDRNAITAVAMTGVLKKNLKFFKREALCKADVDTEIMGFDDPPPPPKGF